MNIELNENEYGNENPNDVENEDELDNKEQLLEGFKNELTTECQKFKANKLLINEKIYAVGGLSNNFIKAKIIKCKDTSEKYGCLGGYICFLIVIFLTVILLSITFILTLNIVILSLLCANYIIATIIQLTTFQEFEAYDSRKDFENHMEKILNCSSKILIKGKKDSIQMPGAYVIDITGEIDIPKSINYILVERPKSFICENLHDMKIKANKMYENKKIVVSREYNGKTLRLYDKKFMVNSDKRTANVDFLDFILCIFLLHWVRALFCKKSFYKCLVITPMKLISRNKIADSPTKINFQGNIIKPKNMYIEEQVNYDDIKRFEDDYQKYSSEQESIENEKEKKRQKKRQKELDTHILSDFSVYDLYTLEIQEYKGWVSAYIKFPHYKAEKVDLGKYDESVEEECLSDGETKKYIPNGTKETITIITRSREIEILIGKHFQRRYKRSDY